MAKNTSKNNSTSINGVVKYDKIKRKYKLENGIVYVEYADTILQGKFEVNTCLSEPVCNGCSSCVHDVAWGILHNHSMDMMYNAIVMWTQGTYCDYIIAPMVHEIYVKHVLRIKYKGFIATSTPIKEYMQVRMDNIMNKLDSYAYGDNDTDKYMWIKRYVPELQSIYENIDV